VKILLTGHRGRIGPAIHKRLLGEGHEVRGFDLADGDDILDASAVASAAKGVEIVVHLAGLADDRNRPPAEVFAVNLTGTANALLAAEQAGVRRFVNMSSGKALGMLERMPDYLPVDDKHRGSPTKPYGLAKWLGEEMCEAFTRRTGMETISLRAVAVFDEEGYARMLANPPPPAPPGGAWHMGAHVDVRDVADSVAAAVTCRPFGQTRVLIAADDVADRRSTRELLALYAPHLPWRGDEKVYAAEPYRGLIDLKRAKKILKWQPRHRWPGREA
jgi:nucleoside-diphosphate-sugar epimerase